MQRVSHTGSRLSWKLYVLALLSLLCISLAACAQTKVSGQYDVAVGGSKKP